jgi:hypothetical protein
VPRRSGRATGYHLATIGALFRDYKPLTFFGSLGSAWRWRCAWLLMMETRRVTAQEERDRPAPGDRRWPALIAVGLILHIESTLPGIGAPSPDRGSPHLAAPMTCAPAVRIAFRRGLASANPEAVPLCVGEER